MPALVFDRTRPCTDSVGPMASRMAGSDLMIDRGMNKRKLMKNSGRMIADFGMAPRSRSPGRLSTRRGASTGSFANSSSNMCSFLPGSWLPRTAQHFPHSKSMRRVSLGSDRCRPRGNKCALSPSRVRPPPVYLLLQHRRRSLPGARRQHPHRRPPSGRPPSPTRPAPSAFSCSPAFGSSARPLPLAVPHGKPFRVRQHRGRHGDCLPSL